MVDATSTPCQRTSDRSHMDATWKLKKLWMEITFNRELDFEHDESRWKGLDA